MTVYERLVACGNEQYRDFQSKLVPNIPKEIILGVKTPDMRKIAKEIKGTKEAEEFLAQLPHQYYEENLVHFFLIAMIRDQRLRRVRRSSGDLPPVCGLLAGMRPVESEGLYEES